jgi:hypothetical protein
MDWPVAIEKNRSALHRVVAGLLVLAGLVEGAVITRLTPTKYRRILQLLRPAEAAVRRLIVVAAQVLMPEELVYKPAPPQKERKGQKERKADKTSAKRTRSGRVSFQLLDPRGHDGGRDGGDDEDAKPRRKGRLPRIITFDEEPVPFQQRFFAPNPSEVETPPVSGPELTAQDFPYETVNAKPMVNRLRALMAALEDIPAQAKRYVRWYQSPVEDRRPMIGSAIRFGQPPGLPKRLPKRLRLEVHDLLLECHSMVLNPPERKRVRPAFLDDDPLPDTS